MTAEIEESRPVCHVSIPDIMRHSSLYEDMDAAFANARRIFHEDQADQFEAVVKQFDHIENPTRNETREFQSDIKAINEESWPIYIRAPPDWKPAPVTKHDNSNVKLMPQRRDISKKTTPIARFTQRAEFMPEDYPLD